MSHPIHSQPHFSHRCDLSLQENGPALWFILKDDSLFLAGTEEQKFIPRHPAPPVSAPAIAYSRCIGSYDELPCMVIELGNEKIDHGLAAVTLREAYAHIGEELWNIAGRASQVLRWRRDHLFCGRCGAAMVEELQELLRRCPQCDFVTYPRLSPAVIMSVVRDGRILLGRAPRFPSGMYSVLAGFVEPGETLEQAVAREVREEVNIEVDDIRYIGSQPWPFPHSLMVGFAARYAGGEIEVDHRELEEAAWFSAAELPRLPSRISIARGLIELFRREYGG